MTDKIWRFFTSLRLTVWTLGFAIALVFLGTLAQVHEGLWDAQERWFRSLLVVREKGDVWWMPPIFPGGYLIGIVLLLNLISAHFKRFQLSWAKLGINLTHFGIILLLIGGLATDKLQREGVMSFMEGETRHFSEDTRKFELAFTRVLDDQREEVVAIPTELLQNGAELRDPKLPFAVKVKTFWANSELQFRAPMQQNAAPLTDKGVAKDWDFVERPVAKDMDERNLPTVILDLGEHGVWVVPSWSSDAFVVEKIKESYGRSVGADVAAGIAAKLSAPQEIEAGGQKWKMAMRLARTYKDFSVTLLKTTHEVYLGTGVPKNYQSRVRLDNPASGDAPREVDISMNNPLRYEGLTFYQSQMDRFERPGFSGLQVVRNPSWLLPYFACGFVALGLCVQFGYHIVGFIAKRRTAAAA